MSQSNHRHHSITCPVSCLFSLGLVHWDVFLLLSRMSLPICLLICLPAALPAVCLFAFWLCEEYRACLLMERALITGPRWSRQCLGSRVYTCIKERKPNECFSCCYLLSKNVLSRHYTRHPSARAPPTLWEDWYRPSSLQSQYFMEPGIQQNKLQAWNEEGSCRCRQRDQVPAIRATL